MSRYIYHYTVCVLVALIISTPVTAQNKSKPFYKSRKAKVECPTFGKSKYPYQGIGIKLGDPFALTYKFYASQNFALALDLGKSASGLYSKYHRNNFGEHLPGEVTAQGTAISYFGHKVKHDWVLEGKALYHWDASSLLGGLSIYAGGGLQIRKTKVRYEYLSETGVDQNAIGTFDSKSFSLGPVGAAGLEYTYSELPLAAFFEMELYTDLIADPGWVRLQGGIGLRYLF